MTDKILQILLVEDDRDDALIIQKSLLRAFDGHIMLDHATSLAKALEVIKKTADNLDLILLDVNLPDAKDLTGLNKIADAVNGVVPIIMLTGDERVGLAVDAVRGQAQDYIAKHSLQGEALFRAIQISLARHEKTIFSDERYATLEAEGAELRKRKAKLDRQAQELEALALALIAKSK